MSPDMCPTAFRTRLLFKVRLERENGGWVRPLPSGFFLGLFVHRKNRENGVKFVNPNFLFPSTPGGCVGVDLSQRSPPRTLNQRRVAHLQAVVHSLEAEQAATPAAYFLKYFGILRNRKFEFGYV